MKRSEQDIVALFITAITLCTRGKVVQYISFPFSAPERQVGKPSAISMLDICSTNADTHAISCTYLIELLRVSTDALQILYGLLSRPLTGVKKDSATNLALAFNWWLVSPAKLR
jgi:hypothetical protein